MYIALHRAKHCAQLLKGLPRADPPSNSDSFYLIQMPVEEEVHGTDPLFTPKLPHLLKHISDKEKLCVVLQLTEENEKAWEESFDSLQTDWLTPIVRVRSVHEVNGHGRVYLKTSQKTEKSILAKAHRPAILAENPSFSVSGDGCEQAHC